MNLNDDIGIVKEIVDDKTLSIIVIGGKKEIKISAEKDEVKELEELILKEVIIISFDRKKLKLNSVGE